MGDEDHPLSRLLSSLFFVASIVLLVGWRETGSTMDRIALGFCVALSAICWFGPFPSEEQDEVTLEELEWENEKYEHRIMVSLLLATVSGIGALVLWSAPRTDLVTYILIGFAAIFILAVIVIVYSYYRLKKIDKPFKALFKP